jgi:hypothetical protein
VEKIGTGVHIVKHLFKNSLFEQQARSYLKPCGHPWAALVMFDSVLICLTLGIKTVSLGYEKSADFGNGVTKEGIEINHQYDKSSAFLTLAGDYVKTFLSPNISLKSELCALWELEITCIFCSETSLKPFHPLFLSCNEPVVGVRGVLRGEENREREEREEIGEREEKSYRIESLIQPAPCDWCAKCEKCKPLLSCICFYFLFLSVFLKHFFLLSNFYFSCPFFFFFYLFHLFIFFVLIYNSTSDVL